MRKPCRRAASENNGYPPEKAPLQRLILVAILIFVVLSGSLSATAEDKKNTSKENAMSQYPVFTITLENGQIITGELYPEIAPESVGNFVALANSAFYDGLIFHRVIPGFMVQGGCPTGTGMGGPGYSIKGEFAQNGVSNPLKHTRGVLSMARSMRMDSAGSQFFIMVADAPHLDGAYAAFGKVLSGMEALDQVVSQKRNNADKPLTDQVIKSIRVETNGVEYPFTRLK